MEREFREIVRVLKEARRRKYINDFALTGVLALSALTQPRATSDIDFIVSIEQEKIPFFVEWLKTSKEYRLVKHHIGRPKDRIKNLIEVPAGSTSVDIIVAYHDVEKEALAASESVSVYGNVKIKIISSEYLIVLKLLAGSDQDYIDCAHLWNESIDKNFVRKTAKNLFMERELKKMAGIARRLLRK